MVSIIHQIPMGLIQADPEGNILQLNARGAQLLMPFFFTYELAGDNIHELLRIIAPDIQQQIELFPEASGSIVNQLRKEVACDNGTGAPVARHFVFTINKLSTESLLYYFDDITELYQRDQALHKAMQEEAIERSKFEMASGVLHDIGNAVVGFGSYVVKMKRSVDHNTVETLENLKKFIEKNSPEFCAAIGDTKTNAMVQLLDGLMSQQQSRQKEIKDTIEEQIQIISHIQGILNIQRQYLTGQSTEREPVSLSSVVNDAISMLYGSWEKKGIDFVLDAPTTLPKLRGDRTQLIQVFINLFKNAIDSLSRSNAQPKKLSATLRSTDSKITVVISDNGLGFEPTTSERLFVRGYSTKPEGSGLGLANCKNIIEAHNGSITLTSKGTGHGAVAQLEFHLSN